jgi:hypothetical protein
VVIFNLQLITTVIAKIMMPTKTTIGPGNGKFRLKTLHNSTPVNPVTAPNIALSRAYFFMWELRFLAAMAGTITRKPTSNVPTIWMPMATTTETRKGKVGLF